MMAGGPLYWGGQGLSSARDFFGRQLCRQLRQCTLCLGCPVGSRLQVRQDWSGIVLCRRLQLLRCCACGVTPSGRQLLQDSCLDLYTSVLPLHPTEEQQQQVMH
jgi:hypothetical protein